MSCRYAKMLLPLAAVAAMSVPAVAQARQGSDDAAQHVRREHHRVMHVVRAVSDDGVNHVRHGDDDGLRHR
jgi:hypothetical protein